jgi:phage gp29-like protein
VKNKRQSRSQRRQQQNQTPPQKKTLSVVPAVPSRRAWSLPARAHKAQRWDALFARPKPKNAYLRRIKTPLIKLETTWDQDSVLSARDEHLRGQFQSSGLLWVWMQTTSRLKIVLRKRIGALSALPFFCEPASGEKLGTPVERAAAKIWEREWFTMMPESLRQGIFRQAIGMGASLCRVTVHDDGRHWWPRLTLWPDDAFYYSDNDCCWYARNREGVDKKIKPGCGWFLWLPDGDRSFQMGAVASLGIECLLASMSKSDWANYNKANATVVKKAIVPKGLTREAKNLFLDQVEEVGEGENSTVLCEQQADKSGSDFVYVTAGDGKVTTFKESKADAESTITIEILGQEKTTDDGGVGTYDAVEALSGVEDRLVMGDAEGFATALRAQVLMPFCELNWSRPELAPWVKWKKTIRGEKAAQATEDKAVAEAASAISQTLRGSGKRLDTAKYLERAELPLLDEEPAPASGPMAQIEGAPQ